MCVKARDGEVPLRSRSSNSSSLRGGWNLRNFQFRFHLLIEGEGVELDLEAQLIKGGGTLRNGDPGTAILPISGQSTLH